MLENILQDAKSNDEAVLAAHFNRELLLDKDISQLEFNKVILTDCRFINCDFTGGSFYETIFNRCDFSNSIFDESFWKSSDIVECKGDGSSFSYCRMKKVKLEKSSFQYTNYTKSLWEDCKVYQCSFREAFLSEIQMKKTITVEETDFCRADFFRTCLKGLNLSSCKIEGITLSDTAEELKGAKINAQQAVMIAGLLDIEVV